MTGGGDDVETFRQADTDDAHLFGATGAIPFGAVPPSFWRSVAVDADGRYRPYHRGLAVHELIRRHVLPRTALTRLAGLLGDGRWVDDVEVERVTALGGELPILMPAGGTALVVRGAGSTNPAVPVSAAYLALDRELDPSELLDVLRDRPTVPKDVSVVDVAVSPDRPVARAATDELDAEAG